jgi:hypothetical protein
VLDTIWLQVLILMLVTIAIVAVVWLTIRLVAPPPPEELYWRFIPNWTSDKLRHLHIIDPDMPELARRASETLLHEARRRGER